MRSCFHLKSAIILPPRLCRRCTRFVSVVAFLVVDLSVGEASGRNTERDDDNDYNNDKLLL